MSTLTPTNITFKVQRNGTDVVGLSGLPALVLPARPEVIAFREVPAGKAHEIHFRAVVAVRESDRLVNEADAAEHYRVVGVASYSTPRASHTEVVAEGRLGGG